ncbi:TauD/TfdA family dioxygenase [Geodermatophilus sp. SYSU D01062]
MRPTIDVASIGEDALLEVLDLGPGYLVLAAEELVGRPDAEVWQALEGVASLLGHLLPQDRFGGIRHVIQVADAGMPSQEIFPTNPESFEYHTDGSYLVQDRAVRYVVMYCSQAAPSGGETLLLSAGELQSWLRQHAPEGEETLRQPVPYLVDQDLWGVSQEPVVWAPAIWGGSTSTCARIHRWRMANSGVLTPDLQNALHALGDAVESLRPTAEMMLQPGQLLILHNERVLHARRAFHEGPDHNSSRRLLRLWVGAERAQSLVPSSELGNPARDANADLPSSLPGDSPQTPRLRRRLAP